jgi:ferredoxin
MDLVGIAIDQGRCVGIGRCEELEPDAVEVGGDARSSPRSGVMLPRARAEALRSECPTGAISILEASEPQ